MVEACLEQASGRIAKLDLASLSDLTCRRLLLVQVRNLTGAFDVILAPDGLLVAQRRPSKVRLSLAHTRLVLLVSCRELFFDFFIGILYMHVAGNVRRLVQSSLVLGHVGIL